MLPLQSASFLAFGVVLVLVGANQDALARDLDLDLTRSGLLGASLALGIGIGVVGAGPLFDRFPRRPLFAASTALAAVALLTVDASIGFPRAVLHVVVAGIGAGAYDTLINALVVERWRERAARPMALVHSAATLGAMLGPGVVAWLGSWTASFRFMGACHAALACWAVCVRMPPPPGASQAEIGVRAISTALVPIAAVALAYVGVEAAMTVFAVPYATGALGADPDRGRAAISVFWLGLFAGRLLLLALPRALDPRVLLAAGLLGGASLGIGVLAGARETVVFFATGLPLGCVYPIMIALAGDRFPRARGTAAGLAAGAGAIGGFLVPWLTGAIGDGFGIAAALGALALWCFAIAAAAAAIARER